MSKKKFNSGDKFILEIGEKRMALDEYEIVGTDLWVWGSLLEKQRKVGRWLNIM